MERIATLTGEWGYTGDDSRHQEGTAGKVLGEVLGIVKNTLMMSLVVMIGAALTLLLW